MGRHCCCKNSAPAEDGICPCCNEGQDLEDDGTKHDCCSERLNEEGKTCLGYCTLEGETDGDCCYGDKNPVCQCAPKGEVVDKEEYCCTGLWDDAHKCISPHCLNKGQ